MAASSHQLPPPAHHGPAHHDASVSSISRATDRYRGWPKWARITVPAVAAVVLLSAIAGASEDDGDPVATDAGPTTSTVTEAEPTVSLDDAVEIAQASLPPGIADGAVERVILGICDDDADSAASAAVAEAEDRSASSRIISAAATGAERYCPSEDARERRSAVTGVVLAADALWDSASTTTEPEVAVTSAPVSTTAPRTAATTPATTPKSPAVPQPRSTQPPATQPPVTQPPASSCDPNYSGCLNPNSPDYDCAGGNGNGPDYTGTVQVIGNDHYDLDSDNDGVGCE